MIDVTGIDLHKFVQDAYDLSDHHEAFVMAGLLPSRCTTSSGFR